MQWCATALLIILCTLLLPASAVTRVNGCSLGTRCEKSDPSFSVSVPKSVVLLQWHAARRSVTSAGIEPPSMTQTSSLDILKEGLFLYVDDVARRAAWDWAAFLMAVLAVVVVLLLLWLLTRPGRQAEEQADAIVTEKQQQAGAFGLEEKPMPTTEELVREAKMIAKAQELVARKKLQEVSALLDPMIAKVDRVQEVIVQGVTRAGENTMGVIKKDASELLTQVMDTLDMDATQTGYVMNLLSSASSSEASPIQETTASANPVQLSILLAGLMAPTQLQVTASTNRVVLLLSTPLLCALVFAIVYDYKKTCAGGQLWFWIVAMAVMMALIVCIRSAFVYIASSAIAAVEQEDGQKTAAEQALGSHPVLGLRSLLAGRSKSFFRALYAVDTLRGGRTYQLLQFLTVAVFVWGGVGVGLSMWNIVEDERNCQAQAVRAISHLHSFFYVLFFIVSLVATVLWIITLVASLDIVTLEIMRHAKQFDDNNCPAGLPVVSVLVRAFLLRDVEDTETVELEAAQQDLKTLRERKQRIADEQAEIEKQLACNEQRVAQLSKQKEERCASSTDENRFVEEQARKLEETLDRAGPLLDYAEVALTYGRSAVSEAKQVDWAAVAEQGTQAAQQAASSLSAKGGDAASRVMSEARRVDWAAVAEQGTQAAKQAASNLSAQGGDAASRVMSEARPVDWAAAAKQGTQATKQAALSLSAQGCDAAATKENAKGTGGEAAVERTPEAASH